MEVCEYGKIELIGWRTKSHCTVLYFNLKHALKVGDGSLGLITTSYCYTSKDAIEVLEGLY